MWRCDSSRVARFPALAPCAEAAAMWSNQSPQKQKVAMQPRISPQQSHRVHAMERIRSGLRARISHRVQASRRRLLEQKRANNDTDFSMQFRSEVQSLVRDEVQKLRTQPAEHGAFQAQLAGPSSSTSTDDDPFMEDATELSGESYAEMLHDLEQSLQAEFDRQAEFALAEHVQTEEAAVNAAEAALGGVVCPICQRGWIAMAGATLRCACGFRFDLVHDSMSLGEVRVLLDNAAAAHSASCPCPPEFAKAEQFGVDTLILQCRACGANEVVL